jgi:hypothetical protein
MRTVAANEQASTKADSEYRALICGAIGRQTGMLKNRQASFRANALQAAHRAFNRRLPKPTALSSPFGFPSLSQEMRMQIFSGA